MFLSNFSYSSKKIHVNCSWYNNAFNDYFEKYTKQIKRLDITYVVNWKNNGEEIKTWVVNNPKDPDTTHWSRRIFNTNFYLLPTMKNENGLLDKCFIIGLIFLVVIVVTINILYCIS